MCKGPIHIVLVFAFLSGSVFAEEALPERFHQIPGFHTEARSCLEFYDDVLYWYESKEAGEKHEWSTIAGAWGMGAGMTGGLIHAGLNSDRDNYPVLRDMAIGAAIGAGFGFVKEKILESNDWKETPLEDVRRNQDIFRAAWFFETAADRDESEESPLNRISTSATTLVEYRTVFVPPEFLERENGALSLSALLPSDDQAVSANETAEATQTAEETLVEFLDDHLDLDFMEFDSVVHRLRQADHFMISCRPRNTWQLWSQRAIVDWVAFRGPLSDSYSTLIPDLE